LLSLPILVLDQIDAVRNIWGPHLKFLEWSVLSVFCLEYVLRLIAAPHHPDLIFEARPRTRYLLRFESVIDLIAIVPSMIVLVGQIDASALFAVRLLRFGRALKFHRHLKDVWHEFHTLNAHLSFRAKLFALLEPTGHSGKLHAYVDNIVIVCVLMSVLSVILQSVGDWSDRYELAFHIVDGIAFSVFIVEYLARLYAAPEHPQFSRARIPRLSYARSPAAVIDLLAVLPTLLEWLLPNELDLRILRVFRLLRLLKLTRYTSAVGTLYKVIARERQIIIAAGFVMGLLVLLTASLGYLFEHEAQPDRFENIPQSIYWAVITLASVGYGDIAPVTPMGRTVTVIFSLIGIGIFAIPAGLLASAFSDQLRIDREAFKRRLLHAYEEGDSKSQARALIATEAERLHLSQEDIERLTAEAREEFRARHQRAVRDGALPAHHDLEVRPEIALAQLRLLHAQAALIVKATGQERLIQAMDANSTDRKAITGLIELVEGNDQGASAPARSGGASH
jgi:voltage-gated potassium channel Kch